MDRRLPHHLLKGPGRGRHLGGRGLAGDDLHQTVLGRVVEVVETDEPLGVRHSARQIADELRAQGKTAAAEFFETAELSTATGALSLEDAWVIAQHIEVSDADLDDSWLPAERYEELLPESAAEHAAAVQRVIESERLESGLEVPPERITLISDSDGLATRRMTSDC